ncbi:MAG: DUF4430 domain-containing protein [Planctomycetota bacterium]
MSTYLCSLSNLALVFVCMGLLVGCEETPQRTMEKPSESITVKLEIDFQGLSEDLNQEIEIQDHQSVFELMVKASELGHLKFEQSGYGETSTFITSIDGIQNQMANGGNWLFFVNDEMSKVGCGAVMLSNNDRVTWKFSKKYVE